MLLDRYRHHRFISSQRKKENCISKMAEVRQRLSPHGQGEWINWRSIRRFQSSQNDPFVIWLDRRMTYRQPQIDWGIHRQRQLKGITGRNHQRLRRWSCPIKVVETRQILGKTTPKQKKILDSAVE